MQKGTELTNTYPTSSNTVPPGAETIKKLKLDTEPIISMGLTESTIRKLNQLDSAQEVANAFPEFYGSQFIKDLSLAEKWSITDNTKRPIDAVELIHNGRARGAWDISPQCLVRLPTIMHNIPRASNVAYHLDGQSDGYLVLDIEKSCHPNLAIQFIERLPWVYAERSMSGYGFHLVLPLPENYWDYSIAAKSAALKSERGTYEILSNHWVTFTRQPLSHDLKNISHTDAMRNWNAIYAKHAEKVVRVHEESLVITNQKPEIPYEEAIVFDLLSAASNKTPTDFYGDHSKYHFHLIHKWRRQLDYILPMYLAIPQESKDETPITSDTYDISARSWLIYEALQRKVPHRPKHEETRKGMPFLLDRVVWALGGVND